MKNDKEINKGIQLHTSSKDTRDFNSGLPKNIEDRMLELLDHKDFLIRYATMIESLTTGKLDAMQFMKGVAPDMALRLVAIATSGETEKSRLAAIQDILDRSGYSKVEKHAIATVDPNVPKEQLMAMLEGLAKKTKVIDIED